MGPGFFILAVMGCADSGMMCEEIERRETLYRSEVACMADSEDALVAASEASYPMLLAQCHRVSPQIAEAAGANRG